MPSAATRRANCARSRTRPGSSSPRSTRRSTRTRPPSRTGARSRRSRRSRPTIRRGFTRKRPLPKTSALAAPAWKFVSNNCFSFVDSPWAVLDHCYYKYKLANDGSSSYDWYALQSVRDGEPQLAVGARSRADPRISERRFVPEMGRLDAAEQLVRWRMLDDEHRDLHAGRRHLQVVRAMSRSK